MSRLFAAVQRAQLEREHAAMVERALSEASIAGTVATTCVSAAHTASVVGSRPTTVARAATLDAAIAAAVQYVAYPTTRATVA